MNRVARAALVIVGLVALVTGGIWFAQGIGVLPGSFMTGDRMWLVIGLVVGVAGLVLIAIGFRRRRRAGR